MTSAEDDVIEVVDTDERRGRAQLVLVHPRFLYRKALQCEAVGLSIFFLEY